MLLGHIRILGIELDLAWSGGSCGGIHLQEPPLYARSSSRPRIRIGPINVTWFYLISKSTFAHHELGCVRSVQTIHTVCPKNTILHTGINRNGTIHFAKTVSFVFSPGKMCSSRKYPYHSPPQKVNGNSKGEGVAKAQVFKEKYGAKLEFPEGWVGGEGVQPRKPSVVRGGGGGRSGSGTKQCIQKYIQQTKQPWPLEFDPDFHENRKSTKDSTWAIRAPSFKLQKQRLRIQNYTCPLPTWSSVYPPPRMPSHLQTNIFLATTIALEFKGWELVNVLCNN